MWVAGHDSHVTSMFTPIQGSRLTIHLGSTRKRRTAHVGRPKGPAYSIISRNRVRCVKGRCGTPLRFVSSLGLTAIP